MASEAVSNNVHFRDLESLRFLHGVNSRDPIQRSQCFDNIMRIFDGWLEGYGSPKELAIENNHLGNNDLSTDLKFLIREQLPDLLRLNHQCPYTDVRERAGSILQELQVSFLLSIIKVIPAPSVIEVFQTLCGESRLHLEFVAQRKKRGVTILIFVLVPPLG